MSAAAAIPSATASGATTMSGAEEGKETPVREVGRNAVISHLDPRRRTPHEALTHRDGRKDSGSLDRFVVSWASDLHASRRPQTLTVIGGEKTQSWMRGLRHVRAFPVGLDELGDLPRRRSRPASRQRAGVR